MSESPERKVLKETLGKLKEKTITSKERYDRFKEEIRKRKPWYSSLKLYFCF